MAKVPPYHTDFEEHPAVYRDDGLRILVDLQKLDKAKAVKALEGILIRLKA